MHVHLKVRQTNISPYVVRCIARWLQELRAGRTDIMQACLTLVKYPHRSYTPYEAHLYLVLDGPVLSTIHPGQTQIEAVQAVMRTGARQLEEWPGSSRLRSRDKAREYGRLRVLRRHGSVAPLVATGTPPGPGQAHAGHGLRGESLWSYLALAEGRTAAAPGSPAVHGTLRWI